MNFREELRRSVIRDEAIHLSTNLSHDDLCEMANWLQYHLNKGDIPHWRPIAFTLHHHEDTFMKSVQKSNAMLGDSIQTITNRIADKVSVGEFYVPPKNLWGYTVEGDYTPLDNEWADIFGFNGNSTNGVGKVVPKRRRDILLGNAEDYNIAFCRDCTGDEGVLTYTSYKYEVPTSEVTKFSHVGVNTTELLCMTGRPVLHQYNKIRANSVHGFGLKDIRPVFIILFKRDSGYRTSAQNSLSIIPELRDSFCFADTDYSLNKLLKVKGIKNNTIQLECYDAFQEDKQIEACLKNI